MTNHYETLQVAPNSHHLVISKVYRVLAAMYHPDNQQTGDAAKFREVCEAYEVLSDVRRRKEYDEQLLGQHTVAQPIAATDDDIPKPTNQKEIRNLVLQLLYENRVASPYKPELGMLVVAEVIGVETEDLEFSRWYLLEKGFIKMSSSADLSITASGVDFVESELLTAEESSSSVLPAVPS